MILDIIIKTATETGIETIVAFVATIAFSMLFNIPRRELWLCGITGAAGWLISSITNVFYPGSGVLGAFLGTLTLTAIGRILSYGRKTPVLIYLIGGVIPLVPGAGLYYTMYNLVITNDMSMAIESGIDTLKIVGVIAIGIMCVLSLPRKLFEYTRASR